MPCDLGRSHRLSYHGMFSPSLHHKSRSWAPYLYCDRRLLGAWDQGAQSALVRLSFGQASELLDGRLRLALSFARWIALL